jgi:DNA-binding response OmpR family regulator
MLHGLVVEDEATVSNVMKLALEEHCHADVTVCDTGAIALDWLGRNWFDFALVDVILPDMSGFEVADRAADLHIPVLFTSGHPDAQLLCQHYSVPLLAKPFLSTLLIERTTELIRQGSVNVAALAAACATLREINGDLRSVISRAQRLVKESVPARPRRANVRYDAVGPASLAGAWRKDC